MKQKLQKIYSCVKCEAQFPKWLGQCSVCGAWGTVKEEIVYQDKEPSLKIGASEVIEFDQVKSEAYPRFQTGLQEVDRVLGGGLVAGSLILLGGEPGIGKSTLVLQIAKTLAEKKQKVLYLSGEESAEQIKTRLERLSIPGKNIFFTSETNLSIICETIKKERPHCAIVDSIQTIFDPSLPSEPGSVAQVRLSTSRLMNLAKQQKITIFIIGHVTKDGMMAGPKTLEHLVDTVLYLEGDSFHHFRLLRAVKNRFGATNETGVFDLTGKGLEEVANPSEFFLSFRKNGETGSAVAAVKQGSRIFLVEIQALVNKTIYGYPQRKAIGLNFNRLQLLLAILSRRAFMPFENFDVYVSLAGGLEAEEPALDLAACLSLVSAFKNKPLPKDLAAFGEVGLNGEIRPVDFMAERIKESLKLGFKKIIVPAGLATKGHSFDKSNLVFVNNLAEAVKILF